jgi:hypothetical protein
VKGISGPRDRHGLKGDTRLRRDISGDQLHRLDADPALEQGAASSWVSQSVI